MMAEFLISFVEKYPQFEGRDFYITGESYAGHYVPAISHNLAFQHKEDLKLNLKGLAIGNGLVAPISQYPEYATFAKMKNSSVMLSISFLKEPSSHANFGLRQEFLESLLKCAS
jgi:carboxypeptidase C (cathepsin A)